MALEIKRVRPPDVREAAVDFFWRVRAWPRATREEYFRYWDWRYTALSEGEAAVWVALDAGVVVGHIALYFREFLLGEQRVLVGVPGNYRVADTHRDTLVGVKLATAVRDTVRRRELDLLLSYGNDIAHAMFTRLGARDLGAMNGYVDVRRWARVLGRRVPAARLLGAPADLATETRRRLMRRKLKLPERRLAIRELGPADLADIQAGRPRPSSALAPAASSSYVTRRYLGNPFQPRRAFGVIDENGELAAHVITEGADQMIIWDCVVYDDRIPEWQAVDQVASALPETSTVLVPLLPATDLARAFVQAGFLVRPFQAAVPNTRWSAYWSASHPLARDFEAVNRWKLWFGWNHY